jgi:rubrerythrin
MRFFEDDSFEVEEEGEVVDVYRCHECDASFELPTGEEPEECPECGIRFE